MPGTHPCSPSKHTPVLIIVIFQATSSLEGIAVDPLAHMVFFTDNGRDSTTCTYYGVHLLYPVPGTNISSPPKYA